MNLNNISFSLKKILKPILTISLYLFSTLSILAQSTFTKGIILSKTDSSKIVHAHIINTTSKIGVTSNNKGEFIIQTKPEDTLIISFIGFESLKINAVEASPFIYITKETYKLEAYAVLPYKDYKEFREAFTNLEMKDTIKLKMNPSIMALVQPFNPSNLNGGLSFSGAISALAAKFNKRIKDKKNYDQLIARDKHKAFLATKFNPKIVKQATLLNDEFQINSFMEYCDFSENFIEFSSHYNLMDQIIMCFKEYKSLPFANK